jgi:cytidylate kinase
MTREMGSLGRDVARGLAAELALRVLYHEIVDNLAEKMHLPSSVVTRFLQGNAGLMETLRNDMDALSLYTAEEVLDIAARGNLMIRGWGATCLLRTVSHVVCVRVCAPLELRAERIRARLNLTDRKAALHEVKRSDAAHAAAMHRRFGIDWQDAMRYDIVLNTERVSVADCIDQITALSRRPVFQETAASRAHLLHLALSAHVQAALRKDRKTASIRIAIDAPRTGQSGDIVLSGIVVNENERRHAHAVAAQCPGVRSVDNQLRLMSDSGRLRKMENG